MATPPRRMPPSLPASPGILTGAIELLARAEALPGRGAGALRFGPHGLVLVESRSVCWAVAAGMRRRLAQLLQEQREPPLDPSYLKELFRQCKQDRASLLEMLLSTGEMSETGVRAALLAHTTEAIAHLALAGGHYQDFVAHTGYEARFRFSAAEILARLGARRDPILAATAQAWLTEALVPDTCGWAFLRADDTSVPVIVAANGSPLPQLAEMIDICGWASSVFDVSSVFAEDVRIASASWSPSRYVVAWRAKDTYFAASCANRASAARMVTYLDRRLIPNVHLGH